LLLVMPAVFILARHPSAVAAISDDIPAAVMSMLETSDPPLTIVGKPVEIEALKIFYQQRGNQPLWVDGAGASARAQELIRALQAAARDGLDPGDYDSSSVAGEVSAARQLASAELMLSAALVRYAADLRGGRALSAGIERDPRIVNTTDPVQVLSAAAEAPDLIAYMDSLAPASPIYLGLREALARYRSIDAAGGWSQLPDGPDLGPGSTDPRVIALRLRLQLTGDLAPEAQGNPPSHYDEAVRGAVRRFQERHGIAPNGTVSGQTRALLNLPVQGRIRQILANLERARWLPDDLGNPYVLVNLADFHLQVVEGGQEVLGMRVVVGNPQTLTPVFSDKISYIEVNPYWNIPKSIALKEKLPPLRRDPNALKKQNIRVLGPDGNEIDPTTVNWSAVGANNWIYRLRQDPGARNSLGRIKFMFPNPYDIYLHDTPSRALFRRQVRAFSHGCIRVEKPIELATLLLRGNEAWGRARIERTIAKGKNKPILLKDPVPVHLVYLTAWAGRDGLMQFRGDHYNLDAPLVAALAANRE
jgi:murein L,D-transpeptidase YcbB/YkuD